MACVISNLLRSHPIITKKYLKNYKHKSCPTIINKGVKEKTFKRPRSSNEPRFFMCERRIDGICVLGNYRVLTLQAHAWSTSLFSCASLENNGVQNKALAICWKEISNEVNSFTLLLAPTKAKVDKRARIKVKHIKQIYKVYTYFSKWKYFVSSALFIPEGLIT